MPVTTPCQQKGVIVDIGGVHWLIVKQQERKVWSFAGYLQDGD